MNINLYCISFRTQVLILSVFDFFGSIAILGLVIQAFYPALVYLWKVEIYFGYLLPFIFAVGGFSLQIFLAVVLFHGTRKNKRVWCRIWIQISTLLLILKVITVSAHLATGNHDHDAVSYGLLIASIFKAYQIVTAFVFMIKELRDEEGGPVMQTVYLYNKAELDPV